LTPQYGGESSSRNQRLRSSSDVHLSGFSAALP
jgi:hypothetical protein